MSDDIKTYCWRSDCKMTISGFNVSAWKVCSTCKSEVSDSLYDQKVILVKDEKPFDIGLWGINLDGEE